MWASSFFSSFCSAFSFELIIIIFDFYASCGSFFFHLRRRDFSGFVCSAKNSERLYCLSLFNIGSCGSLAWLENFLTHQEEFLDTVEFSGAHKECSIQKNFQFVRSTFSPRMSVELGQHKSLSDAAQLG